MPVYDRRCDADGEVILDCIETIRFEGVVPCPKCGGPTRRALLSGRAGSVIADDIPGGVLIENAICHPDGTPKRYYSKSEIEKAARAAGWTPTGNKHCPMPGSDKAKDGMTTRWATVDQTTLDNARILLERQKQADQSDSTR